jgi:predicted acyltransferase
MLLVNNPGSWSFVYPPLEHAEWNGWTPTDLIFPFFLFIVGVALVYSFARRREEGADRVALWKKVVLRSATIFLIGLLLNGFPYYHLATIRIPGVLQRIGLVYLCTATAYLVLTWRELVSVAVVLLATYAAAMLLVPVPGYGAGVLEPVGNLAQYIDSHLLAGHMWKTDWDPEGLLSTAPAVATCLIGVLTGMWLRSDRPRATTATGMLTAGVMLTLAGLVANLWLPINKNLWSSSYVLFTGGAALLTLAFCYWLIDLRKWERWAGPACVFGANPLTVFVGSGLMARLLNLVKVGDGAGGVWSLQRWCYERLFASWAGPLNGSLAYALMFVGLWWLLMWIPYSRRWTLHA